MADTTVRSYLEHLESALVVRQLQPWHESISKRQVKAPRVYLRDSGLLHALLNLPSQRDLEGHPKVGASWEGFVIDQVIRLAGRGSGGVPWFWATHAGAELDLLVHRGSRRLGFEVKLTSAPRSTRSMHIARQDLRLDRLDVIHAGTRTFDMAEGIRALALGDLVGALRG